MSSPRRAPIAKKACTRCSTQKRKCDRALPECGLCLRLRQVCKYDSRPLASSGPTPDPSPSPRSEISLTAAAFTPSQTKHAIIQRLGSLKPEDIVSVCIQMIDPWFPIMSIPRLQARLPPSWDECSLDLALLCFSINLVATTPPELPEDVNDPSEFKTSYLCAKSWISLMEGFGINTLDLLLARILVTLFEVVHGIYPAAYLSIASTTRAADALALYPGVDASLSEDEDNRQDGVSGWCGILVLDRYITIQSGSQPSLTRSRIHPLHAKLKPHICPTHDEGKDPSLPLCRLSRLFESSALLDQIHSVLYNPTSEETFNVSETMLTVDTLHSLQTILEGETPDNRRIYCGASIMCKIGLLLAFENGSKVFPVDVSTTTCTYVATTSLNNLISGIVELIEPFTLGARPLDFRSLTPFIPFLVYKTASIITGRLWLENDSIDGLRKLVILRDFLKLVAKRWLSCERYLQLLNDDTAPRVLRAIEQA
ncbi:uncharacterized protein LY89DRAFT_735517 [Mollisia scopiformis]|uniref:Zn(2)-C6 fungal-type domain-containing protein n=1 Tax=Mollisia scopiformis TaxID=149040 RepID=A0A194X5E1_MOLSC|nr:uncharacterized protein LY89DRAFT_735517 [Mollisia scopiformis]KUJ15403.1 hypothetical protein LY89DRAFT_735517 [Mollisia scopiformis]